MGQGFGDKWFCKEQDFIPDDMRAYLRYMRGRTGKAAARGNLSECNARPHLVGANGEKRAGAKDRIRVNNEGNWIKGTRTTLLLYYSACPMKQKACAHWIRIRGKEDQTFQRVIDYNKKEE